MSSKDRNSNKQQVGDNVTPISKAQSNVDPGDLEEFEEIICDPLPMPSFVEPALGRAGDEIEEGYFVHNPYVRDAGCFFLSKEKLNELAQWVLSGGMDE